MAIISIDKVFSNSQLNKGILKVPTPPIDATPQSVEDFDGGVSNLKLATDQSEFVSATEQCPVLMRTSIAGGGIAFMDNTTASATQVGVGALGDVLCFRAEGSIPMRLYGTRLDLFRNNLANFTPVYQTGGSLVVDASNNDSLNASVYGLTGATTIQFDDLFDGFSMSFILLDTTLTVFSVTGGSGYTFANRQGHNTPAGQYAMMSVFFFNNTLFFGGDTA